MREEFVDIPSNESVGHLNEIAPEYATLVGGIDSAGLLQPLKIDGFGALEVSGNLGNNASVGLNTVTAPTSSTQIGGVDAAGNLQALQVDASGFLEVSGTTTPPTAFIVTTMLITDTATLIPSTPQPTRQGMTISNLDGVNTFFWGPTAGVTADRVVGTTSGAEIVAGARENFDIRASVYGIAPTGTTIMIKVVEAYA